MINLEISVISPDITNAGENNVSIHTANPSKISFDPAIEIAN